jgi:hypothetical protein
MILEDQFKWDIESNEVAPEQFSKVYHDNLGLAGEYECVYFCLILKEILNFAM